MDQERRQLLHAGAAIGAAAMLAGAAAQAAPPAPPKGRPGEFDFLAGSWKIKNRRRLADGTWDVFDGESTCWTILGGVGSVEELRIPARKFAGMGLRLLDVENGVWYDHWVNARSGVISPPGTPGGFENGVGTFLADDVDNGKPIRIRGVWDGVTPAACRWSQATSRDGGKTWTDDWLMEWTRA